MEMLIDVFTDAALDCIKMLPFLSVSYTHLLWSSLAIKPISMLYEKAEKIDMKLVLSIGAGCLAGVMAYVSVSYGFSAMSTKGVVFCISCLLYTSRCV